MENLPHDPMILMSYVNTQLRDFYTASQHPLDDFCKDHGFSRQDLENTLKEAGFEYNAQQRKFW